MKKIIQVIFILSIFSPVFSQPIRVNQGNHFLEYPDGTAFFWLGDTGWELFHNLDRTETEKYIRKRKEQGFNVIQAVVLHEFGAFKVPNTYGDFPLEGMDIARPAQSPGNSPDDGQEYDYWDHVRFIVETAVKYNMFMAVLPCWGEYVTPRFSERIIETEKSGYDYGWFIGDWLKDYNDHIIWMLGGDRLPDEQPGGTDIWRAMAEGITDAVNSVKDFDKNSDYSKTFMTYHCYVSSSRWFASDPWIDMHSWGSYHEKHDNEKAYLDAWQEWGQMNHKPFINSEPAYENLPVNYDWLKLSEGRFDDFDVRQVAYWSVFAGACGHTYGANEVFQMYKKNNPVEGLTDRNENEWFEALDYKGAEQMQYLKDLMLSHDFNSRVPDLEIIANNTYDPHGKMVATSGEGYIMIYIPNGRTVSLNIAKMKFSGYRSRFFNPSEGQFVEAVGTVQDRVLSFDPPGEQERGNDWVLVLEAE